MELFVPYDQVFTISKSVQTSSMQSMSYDDRHTDIYSIDTLLCVVDNKVSYFVMNWICVNMRKVSDATSSVS